jgi:hypothetical protein
MFILATLRSSSLVLIEKKMTAGMLWTPLLPMACFVLSTGMSKPDKLLGGIKSEHQILKKNSYQYMSWAWGAGDYYDRGRKQAIY